MRVNRENDDEIPQGRKWVTKIARSAKCQQNAILSKMAKVTNIWAKTAVARERGK